MAVAFIGQNNSSSSNAITDASVTCPSQSGSNVVALVMLQFDADPGASVSAVWDAAGAAQSFTQIGSTFNDGFGRWFQLWGLIAPAAPSGTLTAQFAWTNNANFFMACSTCSGVIQTSVAVAFTNVVTNVGAASPTLSITVTSATNNMAAAHFQSPASSGGLMLNQTVMVTPFLTASGGWYAGANYAVGAPSVTFSGTVNTSGTLCSCQGANIVAAPPPVTLDLPTRMIFM